RPTRSLSPYPTLFRSPRLIDLSGETQVTRDLYGIGEPETDRNGRACLLARRLSEAGVRFVQVTMGGWDHHGDIRNALPRSCAGRSEEHTSELQSPDQL